MVLLKRAGPVAARFYSFLGTDSARAILRRHGFAVPQ
jgi:ABC-type molybdate transport system substrate-binding protein